MAWVEAELRDRTRFATFRYDESPEQPLSAGLTPAQESGPEYGEAFQALIDVGLDAGGMGKLLFTYGDETEGFCLMYGWFKPHMVIPRHFHGQDCLYYIQRGSAILGNTTLGPGDGFFVPARHPYAYRAGPEGVEVLEFRHVAASAIDGKFIDPKPEIWARFRDVVIAQQDAWRAETVPPSRRDA